MPWVSFLWAAMPLSFDSGQRKRSREVELQIQSMAWRQISLPNKRSILSTGFAQFSTKSNPYPVKVGIPEFLNGIGNGVEKYAEKLESEFGDLNKLLVTRGLKLKKLGVGGNAESGDKACKHRKLILKFAHKYRLGLWRPRAIPVKSK